ncbi:pyridoxal phosphate-dependent transferase [Apodospora peruviana]|uniref:Pyridoxal phosphate-dependent transferase n=1 Tax=Apodospora peruviana TaxID=516989 RepID=A0AAE0MCC7_9PEZI|nr:pyridoxal phosphate-dependent transferase [Apodospora peruviana]
MDSPSYYHESDGGSESSSEKPLPLDLSHHFSEVTKHRVPSKMKKYYRFFQIPGIGNLAGGLPNVRFFPFDTLEAQTAKPERWTPTPNYPEDDDLTTSSSSSSDPQAAAHIMVPKTSDESDFLKRIDLASALQYGQAQGYPPLLAWVRQFTRDHLHPGVPYRGGPEVTLTNGATDGFSKTLDLFVNSWTEGINDIRDQPGLVCETFVYPSILSQSSPRGVQVAPITADEFGMVATGKEGSLEDVLANWDDSKGKRPHLMYTVTLGHNPTGLVLSVERKKQIYAVCSKYDVIIVEDEPYWYLQFPSAAVEEAKSRRLPPPAPTSSYEPPVSSGYAFLDSLTPSFISIDTDGRVVRLDTFSKTVAPGCRLGWITAQPELIERYVRISESSTQQPSGFVQAMIAELVMGPDKPLAPTAAPRSTLTSLLRGSSSSTVDQQTTTLSSGWKMDGWVRWLEGLRGMYECRMNRMCRILDAGSELVKQSTPTNPRDSEWGVITKTRLLDYSWPRGGMFVWIQVHFESHPLWQRPFSSAASAKPIDGMALSMALLMLLTHKPHLVLVSVGSMFSANEAIAKADGWRYYRLCFAAESEDEVDAGTQRFVDGLHAFWRIKNPDVIKKLIEPVLGDEQKGEELAVLSEKMGQLGAWMGC